MKLLSQIAILICLYSSAKAQTFTAVGIGANGTVRSLVSFDDGISVGGDFTQINGFERINHCKVRETSLNNFTFFNNYTQDFNSSALGTNYPGSTIYAAAWFNQRLHLGGIFLNPDYAGFVSIGYFDTASLQGITDWRVYGSQLSDTSQIFTMKGFNGALHFGGSFTNLNGAKGVGYIESNDYPMPSINAKGNNIYGTVYCLEVHLDSLYAAGHFSLSDTDTVHITNLAVWRDTAWAAIAHSINGPVYALHSNDTGLFIGGAFTLIDSQEINRVGVLINQQWHSLGTGFQDSLDTIFVIHEYGSEIYAAGSINDSINEIENIARWTDGTWNGLGKINGSVYALENHRGRMCLGGAFTKAESVVSRHLIAYHNGREPLTVNDITSRQIARVWPNPSSGYVHIDCLGTIQSIRLINSSGNKERFSLNKKSSTEYELHIEKAGMYIALIQLDSGQITYQKISIVK